MKKTLFTLITLITSVAYSQTVYYVDPSATGSNDGSSWANAYTDLETAVSDATASSNIDIWVKQGTYAPSDSAKIVFLLLANGVHLYGGFDGTESNFFEREPKNNITILDGDAFQNDTGPVNVTNSSRSDNAYTVVYMRPSDTSNIRGLIIDGFTIRGGNSRSTTQSNDQRYGGGIFVTAAAQGGQSFLNIAKISNCIIEYNSAQYESGIATRTFSQELTVTLIENTIFRANGSVGHVVGNAAQSYPAATFITNCLFTGNETTLGNLISTSTQNQNYSSELYIMNSTFADNNIGNKTLFNIYNPYSSGASVRMGVYNSIFSEPLGDTLFKNSATGIADTFKLENNVINSPQILHSGNFAHLDFSNNLVATSPQFVGGSNYELTSSSPAVNHGNLSYYNNFYPSVLQSTMPGQDLGGNYITGTTLDAGAYQLVTASLDQIDNSHLVRVYPNPATQEINIEVKENTEIQIFNNQGQLMKQLSLTKGLNQININNLSQGLYYLQTISGDHYKFIKK